MLISYVLDAGPNSHGMDELAELHLGHKPIPLRRSPAPARRRSPSTGCAIDKATAYAAEDADVTLRLWRVLKPRLVAEGIDDGLRDAGASAGRRCWPAWSARGITIDRQILSRLSGEFAQGLARLEDEIHELAGENFNDRLAEAARRHPVRQDGPRRRQEDRDRAMVDRRRRARGARRAGPRAAAQILDWRQLSKLKSTYTDALPAYVNPKTDRVHTSYALAATTTGRLSSSEPNLQNIPIRTEEGRKIRTAFIADAGHKLISADYCQIELRVLAHIADIPQLRQAFADGIDIHAMTASEMFGVPVEGMPTEVRRRAKAINFGIIYGISAFGLANQLGIAREEAGAYIRKYFERFPGIRDYMDADQELPARNGYVTTIFGRKCHFPAINSKNPSERAFVERQAINAPIQGSAADIIRRAMIRMDAALAAARLGARMLLQVHDELVFEVPEAEVEADPAGDRQGDDRRAAAGRAADGAAAGRRARRRQLGRGALRLGFRGVS